MVITGYDSNNWRKICVPQLFVIASYDSHNTKNSARDNHRTRDHRAQESKKSSAELAQDSLYSSSRHNLQLSCPDLTVALK